MNALSGKSRDEIEKIIVASGKPQAREMIRFDSMEIFWAAYIGKYRLSGSKEDDLRRFKTKEAAYNYAVRIYKKWSKKHSTRTCRQCLKRLAHRVGGSKMICVLPAPNNSTN